MTQDPELTYTQKKAERRLQCIRRLLDVYINHDHKSINEVIDAWEEARQIVTEAEQLKGSVK